MTTPVVQPLDPSEVMVGTANAAGLYIAPENTPPPAKGAPFEAPWEPLGYASDDGPTLSGDTTSETLTPWQSRTPIRTIITERTQTVQFVMWQLNQRTLGLYFNADVPDATDDELEFDVRSDTPGKIYAIGVDAKDGDSQFRIVYPRATLDSAGDMQLQKGAAVPLDVTLSALDANGVLAHVYVKVGGVAQGLTVSAAQSGPTGADIAVSEPNTVYAAPDDTNASQSSEGEPAVDQPVPDEAGVASGPGTDAADQGTTTTEASEAGSEGSA